MDERVVEAAARDLSVALVGISGTLFSAGQRNQIARDLAEIALVAAERAAWQSIETAPNDRPILARRGFQMWVVQWSSDFDEWMAGASTVRGLTEYSELPALPPEPGKEG